MGLNTEQRQRYLPVEMRAEQAALMIGDRVEASFRHGATIYSNGEFGGFGSASLRVRGTFADKFRNGRIFICKAQDVTPGLYSTAMIEDPSASVPRKALVIPEGSDKKLAYKQERNRMHVVLLHGIDNDGKPVTDDLFYAYDFIRFIEKMGQRILHKQDVIPNETTQSYRKPAVKRLEEMSRLENGGLGEFNQAVLKMKEEMQQTALEAERFINGHDK